MNLKNESICYQHQQAQDILEILLKLEYLGDRTKKDLKEAIEWITKANDSAVRMEEKLKWYKDNVNNS